MAPGRITELDTQFKPKRVVPLESASVSAIGKPLCLLFYFENSAANLYIPTDATSFLLRTVDSSHVYVCPKEDTADWVKYALRHPYVISCLFRRLIAFYVETFHSTSSRRMRLQRQSLRRRAGCSSMASRTGAELRTPSSRGSRSSSSIHIRYNLFLSLGTDYAITLS